MKWWERPVRMMRQDYITDLQRVKEVDLDALARRKREEWHINCEWVIGTPGVAPGLGWQTTFDTPKFPKFEALGDFDLVRSYLPHARKYGIHVLAYLNMHWFSYDFAEAHPGWEQVRADGSAYGRHYPLYGNGTTLCVNSPWRDWAFDMIREAIKTGIDGCFLDGPVIYPGCCYCPACREKFRQCYGQPIPEAEDWNNPLWKDFIDFRENSMADFLRDAQSAMREIDPQGVVFLNAGSWHGGGWRVARDMEKVGPYQNFNGAEAFFHPGPDDHALLFWATAAKHLVAGGKPAVVFSHHALGSYHYIPLPPVEAALSVAQAVACGANPWFAIFDYAMDHSAEKSIAPMRRINGFLEARDEYFTRTESAADIALLYSSNSNKYYLSEQAEMYRDPGTGREQDLIADTGTGEIQINWSVRKSICDAVQGNAYLGYFNALTRAHLPFDVILGSGLNAEDLKRYRVLILGNASCLSDDQIAAVLGFVDAGGSVMAEFETGEYDERGQKRMENPLRALFGVRSVDGMFAPATAEEYIRADAHDITSAFGDGEWIPRPVFVLKARPMQDATTPAEVLAPIGQVYTAPQGGSGYPAVIARQAGQGRTVYFPHLLGDFLGRSKIHQAEDLITGAVEWAYNAPLPLSCDAPPSLQVELRRQGDRLLVHLVNNTGDMQRPITQTIPIRDITLRLPWQGIARAYRLSDMSGLPARIEAGSLEISVPVVELYEVVVIAKG
ncbi:MAG: beta-galactosidase trimerization domain-containing protein [Armatimonadetes bacterium]|nr:beta-galactosidase trimerization domain-containing protein [Armatimonadota bacterium]